MHYSMDIFTFDPSTFLIAIAGLIAVCAALWLFYQVIGRNARIQTDKEETYSLVEQLAVEKVADKKGINILKELAKRKMYDAKSFRKKLEEEAIKDFFGKDAIPEPPKGNGKGNGK